MGADPLFHFCVDVRTDFLTVPQFAIVTGMQFLIKNRILRKAVFNGLFQSRAHAQRANADPIDLIGRDCGENLIYQIAIFLFPIRKINLLRFIFGMRKLRKQDKIEKKLLPAFIRTKK